MAPSMAARAPISSVPVAGEALVQPVEVDRGGLLGQPVSGRLTRATSHHAASSASAHGRGQRREEPAIEAAPERRERVGRAGHHASRAVPGAVARRARRRDRGTAARARRRSGTLSPLRRRRRAGVGELQRQVGIARQIGAEPGLDRGAAGDGERLAGHPERIEPGEHDASRCRRCGPEPAPARVPAAASAPRQRRAPPDRTRSGSAPSSGSGRRCPGSGAGRVPRRASRGRRGRAGRAGRRRRPAPAPAEGGCPARGRPRSVARRAATASLSREVVPQRGHRGVGAARVLRRSAGGSSRAGRRRRARPAAAAPRA